MSAFITELSQFIDTGGKPIVNGKVYIGLQNLDPVLNPQTIYADRGLTVILDNPQDTDEYGKSVNKIWIPGRFSMRVDDSAGLQQFIDLDAGEEPTVGNVTLSNVQGADTITAEGDPTQQELKDKQTYIFTAVAANNGADPTLKIDALDAKTIQNVEIGYFQQDAIQIVIYNGISDDFQLGEPQSLTIAFGAVQGDVLEVGQNPRDAASSGVQVANLVQYTGGPVTDGANVVFSGTSGTQIKEGIAGIIQQIIPTQKTDVFSTGSTSNVTVTGLTKAITIKAGSSVLITGMICLDASTGAGYFLNILRDATLIGLGDAAGSRFQCHSGNNTDHGDQTVRSVPISWVDTPPSPGTVTYSIQVRTRAGTLWVNKTTTDTDSADFPRTSSNFTLAEIA